MVRAKARRARRNQLPTTFTQSVTLAARSILGLASTLADRFGRQNSDFFQKNRVQDLFSALRRPNIRRISFRRKPFAIVDLSRGSSAFASVGWAASSRAQTAEVVGVFLARSINVDLRLVSQYQPILSTASWSFWTRERKKARRNRVSRRRRTSSASTSIIHEKLSRRSAENKRRGPRQK